MEFHSLAFIKSRRDLAQIDTADRNSVHFIVSDITPKNLIIICRTKNILRVA